ncbi:MAG: hypothetical protein H7Y31_05990 [Chitinophagaceae bacterium]|nr:hypothetical protein [Chitinophagaceae bacterium]
MKTLKKVLKITGIVLLVLIAFLFAAPYLFKSQIVAFVKKQVNQNIEANVDFKDVDISFFRHFPRVAVALDNLHVVGRNQFASDTLLSANRIDAAVNIMSVIRGKDMNIYSVEVKSPRIHALVAEDGSANWDIVKEDSVVEVAAEDSTPFKMELQHYSIENAYIYYNDKSSGMQAEILNLNHEGSGDFTADLFTLDTKTTADAITFVYGGIPYLSNTKTGIEADIQIDNKINKYTFKTDQINLNALQLKTEGFFQLVDDSTYAMDIKFNAPSTDFKNILSLIPVVYQKDFEKVKTSGQAVFNGAVKGIYDATHIPAYNLNLDVKNGFFQYPDLPKPLKNINLSVQVDNPDGVTDHTVVNIPAAHFELDNDPFDFRLFVKNPISDLFIDAAAKGKLDLSKVSQLVKLDAGTKLTGLLNADVQAKGRITAMEQQRYDDFTASGTIDLNNFLYASPDYPDGIRLTTLQSTFTPKNLTLSNVSGEYMKTNFSGYGQVNNILQFILKDQVLDGSLNVKADKVNLDDWMGESTDTTTTTTASAPFSVPNNINFLVTANVDALHYDKLDIKNLSGALQIANETVQLRNIKGDALDGSMIINGTYSTAISKKKPDITLTYDVKDLDVEKTFYAFNTVQKLMPVGQFIAGKLNSQLTLNGKLGEDMMPDLTSLTGNGNLFLIEGFLSKFKPLEKLAEVLNVKELEKITLRDVKNYIEFANGKVMVKPFKAKIKEIEMEIGGFHGFDQSLDYTINLRIPRALMGDKGNAFVDNLLTQVNNKGVPLKVGDMVPIQVKLGGFINSPQLKTDLKQTAGNLAEDLKKQATEFAKAKIDSAKTAVTKAVKDTVESIKKQATKAAEDEIKKRLFGKDSTAKKDTVPPKKKLEETGKGLIKDIFKKKQKDTTKN